MLQHIWICYKTLHIISPKQHRLIHLILAGSIGCQQLYLFCLSLHSSLSMCFLFAPSFYVYAYGVTMCMHAYMYVSYVFKYGSVFHHMKKLTTFTILMCACVFVCLFVLAGWDKITLCYIRTKLKDRVYRE